MSLSPQQLQQVKQVVTAIKPSVRQIVALPVLVCLYHLLCSSGAPIANARLNTMWLLFCFSLVTLVYNVCFNLFYAQQRIIDPSKCSVLVTGCSTGFGYTFAQHLLKVGFTVIAAVRKEEDSDKLRKAVPQQYAKKLHTVLMDVEKEDTIKEAAAYVSQKIDNKTIPKLFALVNNAGVAIHGPIELLQVEKIQQGFNVNVFGVIRMVQQFLPLLRTSAKELPDSRIINISSISQYVSLPGFAACKLVT